MCLFFHRTDTHDHSDHLKRSVHDVHVWDDQVSRKNKLPLFLLNALVTPLFVHRWQTCMHRREFLRWMVKQNIYKQNEYQRDFATPFIETVVPLFLKPSASSRNWKHAGGKKLAWWSKSSGCDIRSVVSSDAAHFRFIIHWCASQFPKVPTNGVSYLHWITFTDAM